MLSLLLPLCGSFLGQELHRDPFTTKFSEWATQSACLKFKVITDSTILAPISVTIETTAAFVTALISSVAWASRKGSTPKVLWPEFHTHPRNNRSQQICVHINGCTHINSQIQCLYPLKNSFGFSLLLLYGWTTILLRACLDGKV